MTAEGVALHRSDIFRKAAELRSAQQHLQEELAALHKAAARLDGHEQVRLDKLLSGEEVSGIFGCQCLRLCIAGSCIGQVIALATDDRHCQKHMRPNVEGSSARHAMPTNLTFCPVICPVGSRLHGQRAFLLKAGALGQTPGTC